MIINLITVKIVVNVRFPLYSIFVLSMYWIASYSEKDVYQRLCAQYVTAILFLTAVAANSESAVA